MDGNIAMQMNECAHAHRVRRGRPPATPPRPIGAPYEEKPPLPLRCADCGADLSSPKTDFAFTFFLPSVPRIGERVHYADRSFVILTVEYHPHSPFAVHLIAREELP